MNIIYILYYTILRFIRDRKGLVQLMLFPIVLILILGSALSSNFNIDDIGKTSVAYLNLDGGAAAEAFEGFLGIEDIEKLLEINKVNTYEEGVALIKERKVAALIYIKEGYSHSLQQGGDGEIKVIRSSYNNYGATIVKSIVESYVNASNAIEATAIIGSFNPQFIRVGSIKRMPINSSGRTPTSMDYYSVTMLAMMIMYGANYGINEIGKDYFDSIGGRMKAAPIKAYQLYIGKTLGVVSSLFMQAMIIILFTKYVFKVNWGDNILMIMFIVFSLAMLSVGLGVMICMLSSSRRKAYSIISILVPVFTFISGGYVPIDNIGGILSKLKFLSPNYLTQRAIFNQIFEGSSSETQLFIMIIWAVGLLTFMTSAIAGRRQAQ